MVAGRATRMTQHLGVALPRPASLAPSYGADTLDRDTVADMRCRIVTGLIVTILLIEMTVARAATIPPASDANRVDTPDETLKKAAAMLKDLAVGDIHALRRGPLLLHGNFCGIGGHPGLEPVDALDAACMRHDACTRTGSLPSCACDKRLEREAQVIADNPATKAELKALAAATAASMAILVCQ